MNSLFALAAFIMVSISATPNEEPPVQVVKETIIVVPAPPKKVWVCSAPQGLQNDEVQTVRRCEWR